MRRRISLNLRECVAFHPRIETRPTVKVNAVRCVGCGVCVINCSTEALGLARRPEEEVLHVPVTHTDWEAQRAAERGL